MSGGKIESQGFMGGGFSGMIEAISSKMDAALH